jgi:membrane associated rhomboid family serine protease
VAENVAPDIRGTMPEHDTSAGVTTDEVPPDLVEVGSYATSAMGSEHGLVVLAMGGAYWLVPSPEGWRLLVESRLADNAREQLARFDRESAGWPPHPAFTEPALPKPEFFTPLLWSLAILAVFWRQQSDPSLIARGALDAGAVFRGHEWWRVASALFLHRDAAHVVANGLSGILVFSAVLSTIGRVRGWLLLALSSLAGNVAAAAIHFPGGAYRSIGASTAVFAGLGLLTGRAVRVAWSSHRSPPWRVIATPLLAGLAVLALYGAGGVYTDVGAHAAGFASGVALGFVAGTTPRLGEARVNRDVPYRR